MHDGQWCVPRQQDLEGKGAIERLVPGPDATGKRSAHWQGTGKTIGEQLNQPSRDDTALRVAPGDRTSRGAAGRIEEIKQGDLIVEGLLNGPAVLAVRRASQRVALLQECSLSQSITNRRHGGNDSNIRCRVEERLGGKNIAVTVENQRAIPVRRDSNRV